MKLRRPETGDHYVRRRRLFDLIDEAVLAPLTLVVAPAGSGKTSLLTGWIEETSTRSAWLSLDETDRDSIQLWSGLIAALESIAPGCGQQALAMIRRPGERGEYVDQLLVDLDAEAVSPAVLVVDDFHLVDDDPAVAASVARFVTHLPAWLHVVLMSRRDPAVPVDRLRSRGQLGEIRFAELRFSSDEATELLNRLAPSLSGERIDAAVERAGGWVASLQLVALATRTTRAWPGTEASNHGDDLLLADYVRREVLANEPAELIDVLSAAAVVPQINASLAQALTRRPDAGDLLMRAEERGLFVSRRGSGGWFDLHALVGDVLTAELARRSPDRLAELHTRAARWFEDADEVVAALEQWLRAGHHREALRLLSAKHASLYDAGREAVVAGTIGAIPATVATGDVEAMVEFAWCHLLVDRRRFLELVEQLRWWCERSEARAPVCARVTMLQSMAATVNGEWASGGALAREAILELGLTWWQDPIGRFGWNEVARAEALAERWDEAGDVVREARLSLSRDPDRSLAFEGTRALGHALAGHPYDALRLAAGVRPAAIVSQISVLWAELQLAEALAHRELADRERADAELTACAGAPVATTLYCRIVAALELVQTHLDTGDLVAARELFGSTEALIESESFGSGGRGWLGRVGTRLALAAGDVDEAWRWAEQVDDELWGPVCAARIHLAAGNRAGAATALEPAAPRCVRHEVVLSLLRARSFVDREEAMKYAANAVEVASDNGLLQTVASEGAAAIELVEQAAWRAPAEWLDRLRRAAAEVLVRPDRDRLGLVVPLTERERDVLRFLPSRLTIREIADELYVSVNTLKFHLKVIYRKLGVKSRAEAAEIARTMTAVRH